MSKFRGRCIKTGKWVYGSFWKTLHNSYILELKDEIKPQNPILIIPKTLGQYSDVKDIDGKEIYDGDVVKNDVGDVGGINFDCGAFWINYYQEPSRQNLSDFVKYNVLTEEYYTKIKVIGKNALIDRAFPN
tara:strand:+ start:118 stop:510 length:393 start_codon:yes stop_codon:yes gene_type:complete